jgi:arginyl-tRNA synthetase
MFRTRLPALVERLAEVFVASCRDANARERANLALPAEPYVYGLATAFTTFYDECPVLKAEPTLRASRLELTRLAARTMTCGLGLLGISVPDRM